MHLNTHYVVCQASYELHVCTLFACALQLCLGKPALNIYMYKYDPGEVLIAPIPGT